MYDYNVIGSNCYLIINRHLGTLETLEQTLLLPKTSYPAESSQTVLQLTRRILGLGIKCLGFLCKFDVLF